MNKVKPNKHLGQHFLNDENVALSITDLLSTETKKVVEIGPGMGVLTKYLLQKDIDLKLVELDKDSILYLTLHYPALEKSIIEADFLQIDLKIDETLLDPRPFNLNNFWQGVFEVFSKSDYQKNS